MADRKAQLRTPNGTDWNNLYPNIQHTNIPAGLITGDSVGYDPVLGTYSIRPQDFGYLVCDGTLGQEVAIVNRIQADIDSGEQNLAYRLIGVLNVSDTPQFGSNTSADPKGVFYFSFVNNPTATVVLDFTECTLREKDISLPYPGGSPHASFIFVTGGGETTVIAAKINYSFLVNAYCYAFCATANSTLNTISCMASNNSSSYHAFIAANNATLNATNCTTGGQHQYYYAFSANNATLNAINCQAKGRSSYTYGAFYAHNGGVLTATNCTADGNNAANGHGAFTASGATLNAINCTAGGSVSNSDYGAFTVNNSGTLNATNCRTSGDSGGWDYTAFRAFGGTLNVTNSITGGSHTGLSGTKYRAFDVRDGAFLNGAQISVNVPFASTAEISLASTSKYIITNCRFPNRTMSGMPTTDKTTGTQIWCNNIYS